VLNSQGLRLGTDRYQINSSGSNAQHNSPYGSLIGQHKKIPYDETMLGQLSDRNEVVSVAGATSSTNLGAYIDRRVRGYVNLEGIGRLKRSAVLNTDTRMNLGLSSDTTQSQNISSGPNKNIVK
jgi:hypothetical protein